MYYPQWKYLKNFRQQNKEFKQKQKLAFDHRDRARPLPPIADDEDVWVSSGQTAVPG